MRQIDWGVVPSDNMMVLLTVPDLMDGVSFQVADFKDSHAVAYTKTGNFLGLNRSGGIRLGKPPIEMIDGIWYLQEDLKAQQAHPDLEISAADIALRLIP